MDQEHHDHDRARQRQHDPVTLLALARDGRIEAEKLGTHHFKLDQILEAYDVIAAPDEHDALKVVVQA